MKNADNLNINNFILYLKKMGYSESTTVAYFFSIKSFLDYLTNKKIGVYKFTEKNIKEYLLEMGKNKSERTINLFLSSLESFFRYFGSIGIEKKFNLPKIKITKSIKRNLFIDDLDYLIKNIEEANIKEIIRSRNKILIKILYYPQYSNIKTKDILGLKFVNIFNENKIDFELLSELNNFFLKFKFKKNDFIFFTNACNKINTKKNITEKSAQEIFNSIKNKKYKGLTLLNLRKSYYHKLLQYSTEKRNSFLININNKDSYLNYLSIFIKK